MIYLCGPIDDRTEEDVHGWRDYAKEKILVGTLDPTRRGTTGSAAEIVKKDKEDILNSTGLLVYYDRPSVGTSMEILLAYLMRKPIVLVNASGNQKLSPWLICHVGTIVDSLDEGISVINSWSKELTNYEKSILNREKVKDST